MKASGDDDMDVTDAAYLLGGVECAAEAAAAELAELVVSPAIYRSGFQGRATVGAAGAHRDGRPREGDVNGDISVAVGSIAQCSVATSSPAIYITIYGQSAGVVESGIDPLCRGKSGQLTGEATTLAIISQSQLAAIIKSPAPGAIIAKKSTGEPGSQGGLCDILQVGTQLCTNVTFLVIKRGTAQDFAVAQLSLTVIAPAQKSAGIGQSAGVTATTCDVNGGGHAGGLHRNGGVACISISKTSTAVGTPAPDPTVVAGYAGMIT